MEDEGKGKSEDVAGTCVLVGRGVSIALSESRSSFKLEPVVAEAVVVDDDEGGAVGLDG